MIAFLSVKLCRKTLTRWMYTLMDYDVCKTLSCEVRDNVETECFSFETLAENLSTRHERRKRILASSNINI
jgi:hypothetical protein